METSLRKRLLAATALVAVVAASSLVDLTYAADGPAPSPTSGAFTVGPAAALASLSAIVVGFLVC